MGILFIEEVNNLCFSQVLLRSNPTQCARIYKSWEANVHTEYKSRHPKLPKIYDIFVLMHWNFHITLN